MTVQEYIDSKYGAGGPGSGRFEPDPNEVHASHLAECQRKRYWKHKRDHSSDPSVYFELGRVFELLYGAALAFEHDPAITQRTLKSNQPWEVAGMSTRVQQDVGVTIELGGGVSITGESDWVVFEDDRVFEHATVSEDGERTVTMPDGSEVLYDEGNIEKVVETKTKGDLAWLDGPVEKHTYQLYPYMHGLDCPGEVAYMTRDDFQERVYPVEYEETKWLDCVARARRHSANMSGDEVPIATPLDESACKWCDFKDDCRAEGGSEYV